MKKSVKLNNRW